MARLDDFAEAPRRTMVLFYLIDCSGSMRGEKIGQVNDAIRTTLPELQRLSDENPDAEIKVAAMTFSNSTQWITSEPRLGSEFRWVDVEASGLTSLGEACEQLEKKLSRSAFLNSPAGMYAPAIILLSDGGPTDDFESGLAKLKNNNWFKKGIKFAIAIGDDADIEVLTRFTGNVETVIEVKDIESLKLVIKNVSVSVSRVASQSTSKTADSNSIADAGESNIGIKESQAADAVMDQLSSVTGVDFPAAADDKFE